MKLALLFALLAVPAHAQTASEEPVPASLVIMGKGIQNGTQESLLLACVGKGPGDGIPDCKEVRMVLHRAGGKPTWAGFSFPALDLARVYQDLLKWYTDARVSGFFKFFDANEIYAFSDQNGWNWAERPLSVDGQAFKRILMSISAYSYSERSKAGAADPGSGRKKNKYRTEGGTLNPLPDVTAAQDVAITTEDPCDLQLKKEFDKSADVYVRNENTFRTMTNRVADVHRIAEQFRLDFEQVLRDSDSAPIAVDGKTLTGKVLREFLALKEQQLAAAPNEVERKLLSDKFEDPSGTSVGVRASAAGKALQSHISARVNELAKSLDQALEPRHVEKYWRRPTEVRLSWDYRKPVTISDVEVCMNWATILDVDYKTVSSVHDKKYCYSLLDPKRRLNFWRGVAEADLSFSDGKQYPALDAWKRTFYWSRFDTVCDSNSADLHLKANAAASLIRAISDHAGLRSHFLGPVVTYAQFVSYFNPLWNEYLSSHPAPSLPTDPRPKKERKAEKWDDRVSDIIQRDVGKYLYRFVEFAKSRESISE